MTSKLFEKLANENRAALITFVTCGDPNLDFSEKLIEKVCKSGADIVVLGVPFSDPMADGSIIEESFLRALDSDTNLEKIFAMTKRLRAKGVNNPFVMYSYFNPIFNVGIEKVIDKCVESKIDSLMVLDVPLEESEEITSVAKPKGVEYIPLAAPDSSLERMKELSENGGNFLYYATVSGVTGVRGELSCGIAERLAEVRKISKLPVAAGLGMSTAENVREAALNADGVVVASKIVDMAHRVFEESGESVAIDSVGEFVANIAVQMKR